MSDLEDCLLDRLPDEVLEFILCNVSPYLDLQNCALVCKRWRELVRTVRRRIKYNFHQAIVDFNIRWTEIPEVHHYVLTIAKRHSHSACCYDNSMYIFGGCTSTSSTYNDLWKLDLTRRHWVRPLTMGTYPTPKACASMVCYKGKLILYGGWSFPSPYPLHQEAYTLFNELHEYCIETNRWTAINTVTSPPSVAGHSATIHGSKMVVFGGMRKNSPSNFERSNRVWVYDFEENDWYHQPTSEVKPKPRFGHTQIKLSETHLLIIGGGRQFPVVFDDVWLLDMSNENPKGEWVWSQIEVIGKYLPNKAWCNSSVKVGQYVVTFAENIHATALPIPKKNFKLGSSIWVPPREDEVPIEGPAPKRNPVARDRDVNVNGRRGVFQRRNASSSSEESDVENPALGQPRPNISNLNPRPGVSAIAQNAGRPAAQLNRLRNRERQLEILRRQEEKFKNKGQIAKQPVETPKSRNTMAMYVLDISEVLSHKRATWLPPKVSAEPHHAPESTVLYSLVLGMSELIMFGGVEKDDQELNNYENTACSHLRIISAPKDII
ncbi:F-box only protein 42-like [Neocloeon triangulifer]|uniref:F-box only protein 42-like n=1 Tax=Neocloeon triangulifer TaxID=2078957 RepID=UPI00286F941C|nr:F-box only protein 42-like [Neocloeon triangulifer]